MPQNYFSALAWERPWRRSCGALVSDAGFRAASFRAERLGFVATLASLRRRTHEIPLPAAALPCSLPAQGSFGRAAAVARRETLSRAALHAARHHLACLHSASSGATGCKAKIKNASTCPVEFGGAPFSHVLIDFPRCKSRRGCCSTGAAAAVFERGNARSLTSKTIFHTTRGAQLWRVFDHRERVATCPRSRRRRNVFFFKKLESLPSAILHTASSRE